MIGAFFYNILQQEQLVKRVIKTFKKEIKELKSHLLLQDLHQNILKNITFIFAFKNGLSSE